MNQSFLSLTHLFGWRLRTTDGMTAGLLDALLDTDQWTIRLLVAEAEGWAPERELLIAPRMVAGYDEVRAELDLDTDAETLLSSPAMSAGDGLAGFGDEDALPPDWDAHWRAEIDPDDVVDPPPAPADEVESEVAADLGAETDLSADDVLRAETLLGWSVETADGVALTLNDLVFDDRDWALAYLDLSMGGPSTTAGGPAAADPHGSEQQCLVPRQSIDWLDPAEETLHLAVGAQELRTAPAMPSPVAFDERAQVRVYEPA
ncbi:hypothetical protein CKO42_20640 [Lamprobacter modestohalophilus]|uniref:Uncharacterized protein n=1 Tax=Lamprobacter modestohalophilus TaxID=1064514 RepID=A0A9X0WC92_9GAMM|nr:hypothetical protein [Lamprobacter modestohalophilus]MBK1620794.1 hypothetical protein [Lamprobacter modestohalophilus]